MTQICDQESMIIKEIEREENSNSRNNNSNSKKNSDMSRKEKIKSSNVVRKKDENFLDPPCNNKNKEEMKNHDCK